MQYEFTRSVLIVADKATDNEFKEANRILDGLKTQARQQLLADGIAASKHHFTAIAECRYVGQGFELRAALPKEALSSKNIGTVVRNFYNHHRQVYGHAFEDQSVEIITLRVIGAAAVETLKLPNLKKGNRRNPAAAKLYTRDTVFDDGKAVATPRFDRRKLLSGDVVTGPALIVQHNSTTLIPPKYSASVLSHGDIRIAKR